MNSLAAYHFAQTLNGTEFLTRNLQNTFMTCQRSLVFFSCEEHEKKEREFLNPAFGFQKLQGEELYEFLLQLVCGLQSVVIGETEIQGQFKNFVSQISSNKNFWLSQKSSYFQKILADAKEIRKTHLLDLGHQSYGSLTRKKAKNFSSIAVIGAGQLAVDIEPWLGNKDVHFFSRRQRGLELKENSKNIRTHSILADFNKQKQFQALVVAAPIENTQLLTLLEFQNPNLVILDWRGESELSLQELPLCRHHYYFSFKALTQELQSISKDLKVKIDLAKIAIKDKSQEQQKKSFVRPLGWDDLCA